jgi:hypothetical protein
MWHDVSRVWDLKWAETELFHELEKAIKRVDLGKGSRQ